MMSESENGTLVVEVPKSAIQRVKQNVQELIKLRNVRGISLFFGLGEEKPFNMPEKSVVMSRLRKNMLFFATNYALVAMAVGSIAIMLNPFFLFVLLCLGGFWFYVLNLPVSESPDNTTVVFGREITPEQRRLGMITVSFLVIIIFGGSVLFTIFGASTALSCAHGLLRDCPVNRDDDELGFLQGGGMDIEEQGSPDHRGSPEALGRVVTLISAKDMEEFQDEFASLEGDGITWGRLYKVPDAHIDWTLESLDTREQAGYDRAHVEVHCLDGPSTLEEMAHQIATRSGLSGPNIEYLFRLCECMRVLKVNDPHLYALERAVTNITGMLDEMSSVIYDGIA
ncbi:unnamed protein product [Albugo candida]|uniref:glutathione-specific gamma-glutamylcyclotransferase n=1 Tax=Albugo candida TaxID=65357 RepID=A0A024G5S4_9STRA|nr:unnamed protein product [Albugo candida]|eukprot:CCI41670.1 unnamed protein product [Albugo candida]